MPRRATLSILVTVGALALLLSFKTPDAGALPLAGGQNNNGGYYSGANAGTQSGTNAGAQTGTGTQSGRSGVRSGSAANGGSNGGSSGVTATSSGTVTGPSIGTPFGPVQVQVVLQSGKIADVTVLSYPSSHGRSVAINQYALPILRQEVLQAQSANVDIVSGATYTSQAYMQSLQAALDQAHA